MSVKNPIELPNFYPEVHGKLDLKIRFKRNWNPFHRKSFCESLEEHFGLSVVWYENSVVVYKDGQVAYQEFFIKDKEHARSCATMKLVSDLSKP
jgi:hypothetical protein